ncbi:MAG: glycerol kinase [Gammaproteobacteria bacterium RIFCSPHIGHO2_12_FULL_35_23]|nr:MAG: glycerol kinase [Gammaproteobacteria bacterium RIFCSPHIGHO2_12_FULL_35_23]
MERYILAIDQGTTSSRAILFNELGRNVAKAQQEFAQYFPNNAWVEHDPEEIWQSTLTACKQVMKFATIRAKQIAAIGITNQRETTVLWDRETGKPLYHAIVWQDRRTTDFCAELKARDPNIEATIYSKTGLLLDPYFSASKLSWLLDHIEGAREKAKQGKLAFGTIDSFLLYRFTRGKNHLTDITNASRTMLCNLKTLQWDEDLLKLFNIPRSVLPEIRDNCFDFGMVAKEIFGIEIPITGMAGDQQAASIGQACFHQGMVKSTFGTGCFVMVHTGNNIIHSKNRLLTTIMSRIEGKTTYALEGSIFIAGAAVKWLRDKLGIIREARETEVIARSISSTQGVYLVPAFTGLGAPYWRPEARGAIVGITRDTGKAEIVRAVLEAVGYQTRDLFSAISQDGCYTNNMFRVDGGMVENNWLLQFLADILNINIERPVCIETTALGAAYLAGLQIGYFSSFEQIERLWQKDATFNPKMANNEREILYQGWQNAVQQICL